MSYSFYDSDGWICDASTITGWSRLREWLSGRTKHLALLEFLEEGSCEDLDALRAALAAIKGQPADPGIASSLATLREAAAAASDVLILSDGSGIDLDQVAPDND